ncbi:MULTISPECIES: hypothetical protein [unclassified Brevundimonas]|uniref:hypothetical protein n=1 Tax=unclassified Brevundimonas TaxID=2622653 RepID=UPI003F8F6C2D
MTAATKKPLTRTRLIGFAAMGVCALGYAGMGLALLAGKLDYLDMTYAALIAAVSALIGEIGLWVGAGCLGLTLFKKRKAMIDRLFRRSAQPASQV